MFWSLGIFMNVLLNTMNMEKNVNNHQDSEEINSHCLVLCLEGLWIDEINSTICMHYVYDTIFAMMTIRDQLDHSPRDYSNLFGAFTF